MTIQQTIQSIWQTYFDTLDAAQTADKSYDKAIQLADRVWDKVIEALNGGKSNERDTMVL